MRPPTPPTNPLPAWVDTLRAHARRLAAIPGRAARSNLGKRTLIAALAALTLTGTVRTLYAHAEAPAQLRPAPAAATHPTPAPAPHQPAPDPKHAAPPTGKPVKPTPEQAAAAFYAHQLGLPADRVRPLMQQRVNDTTVQVLVMAQRGPEDLPTRMIQVNRTQTGWRVP